MTLTYDLFNDSCPSPLMTLIYDLVNDSCYSSLDL